MAAALFSKGGPKGPTIRVREDPKMQMVVWVSDSTSAPITERRRSTKLRMGRLRLADLPIKRFWVKVTRQKTS